jgi:hypothetical protein
MRRQDGFPIIDLRMPLQGIVYQIKLMLSDESLNGPSDIVFAGGKLEGISYKEDLDRFDGDIGRKEWFEKFVCPYNRNHGIIESFTEELERCHICGGCRRVR